jgi:hypothetical protein
MYDAVEKVLSERSIAQNRPKASKNHSPVLPKGGGAYVEEHGTK